MLYQQHNIVKSPTFMVFSYGCRTVSVLETHRTPLDEKANRIYFQYARSEHSGNIPPENRYSSLPPILTNFVSPTKYLASKIVDLELVTKTQVRWENGEKIETLILKDMLQPAAVVYNDNKDKYVLISMEMMHDAKALFGIDNQTFAKQVKSEMALIDSNPDVAVKAELLFFSVLEDKTGIDSLALSLGRQIIANWGSK